MYVCECVLASGRTTQRAKEKSHCKICVTLFVIFIYYHNFNKHHKFIEIYMKSFKWIL